MDSCKQIVLSVGTTQPSSSSTTRKKVIAETIKWKTLSTDYFTNPKQLELLQDMLDLRPHTSNDCAEGLAKSHIKTKISSYKAQDACKSYLDTGSRPTALEVTDVVRILLESALKCFYCREDVKLFYEHVRDPKQWSLERINNLQGHDADNVVIACLACNIRRRTMHQERYVITKQLKVRKLPGDK
jgi:hypothetical protein